MKRFTGLVLCLLVVCFLQGQHIVNCLVKDSSEGEPLTGVSVNVKEANRNAITPGTGSVKLNLPAGTYQLTFSHIGFTTKTLNITVPLPGNDSNLVVLMGKEEKEMQQVVVSSSRTDSRIENTPTRVEVLGEEEVDDESGIHPSNIASMLGDVAGIQSQLSSATTGNTELHIQGLPGNYSQILRDGVPLFGGYAGSFSILQIPPLDIRQIEIIKGPHSTLYGGGAIAGLINIISKKPKMDEKERWLLLNQTSLLETNLNLYLSERVKKAGYSFFAGGNFQKQMDINGDGFSDLPRVENAFIHPCFYFYPNEKNSISVGINSTYEDRKGGDMDILEGYYSNYHQFFIQDQTLRNTVDINWNYNKSQRDKFTFKVTTSSFNRSISTNVFGMKARQFFLYSEASWLKKTLKHDIVAGINVNGENWKKDLPDSTQLLNYHYLTAGVFIQDDWRLHRLFIMETGIRTDFHSRFGTFGLPSISLLFKPVNTVSMRLGASLGYKIPSVFESDIDERDYSKIRPLNNLVAERSIGASYDLNFRKRWSELTLAFNQSFYYTQINHPLIMQTATNSISFSNAAQSLQTKGAESWLQLKWKILDAYLGFTYTDARKDYDPLQPHLEFIASRKFASIISCEPVKNFIIAVESSYTGSQYLHPGQAGIPGGAKTPSFPILAAMLSYEAGRLTFVLNGEDLNDYRQTKIEAIVIPPLVNPTFKPVWASLEGRVFNLSMRIAL